MQLGVSYYPEHRPEELGPDDARLMREAGISRVRIGEFAWSRVEPDAGNLQWGWLDRAIDILADVTVDALKEAWGNVFWSMEYRSFEEMDPPNLTVTEANRDASEDAGSPMVALTPGQRRVSFLTGHYMFDYGGRKSDAAPDKIASPCWAYHNEI